MSNEEAVKMLRTMQRTVYLGNRKFEDAVECAIKALSEPLQPWEVLAAQAVLSQPEPNWIPVTERLPEGIGRVIAQMDGGAIHDVFYKGKNPYGHVVWVRLDDCIYWDNEVVAWMPMPEPFKGVTE